MQATPVGYILENVPPLGTMDPQVEARCTICVSLLGNTSGSGCSSPGILCPSASMEVNESS